MNSAKNSAGSVKTKRNTHTKAWGWPGLSRDRRGRRVSGGGDQRSPPRRSRWRGCGTGTGPEGVSSSSRSSSLGVKNVSVQTGSSWPCETASEALTPGAVCPRRPVADSASWTPRSLVSEHPEYTSSGFPVGTVAPVWGTRRRFLSAWLTAAVLVLEYSLVRGRNPFESGSPPTLWAEAVDGSEILSREKTADSAADFLSVILPASRMHAMGR